MSRAWVEGVISERIQDRWARGYRWVMTPCSWCFALAVSIRNQWYDLGWLASKKVSCPVLSVGSVEVGGTGKTPVTLWLAELLQRRGYKVAILSRGYGRKVKGVQQVDLTGSTPTEVGDEPWMMAQRLPTVSVIVAESRYAGACLAQQQGAEMILLDDGFQHRQLYRDLDIVVLSPHKPKHFLPVGALRDHPKRIKQADLLLSCHSEDQTLPSISGEIVVEGVYDREGKKAHLPARIALFCGIARPQRWINTVQELGCEVCSELLLADHRQPHPQQWVEWEQEAIRKGAQALVCTEKDWVKGVPPSTLPLIWVRIDFRSHEAEQKIQELLGRKGI